MKKVIFLISCLLLLNNSLFTQPKSGSNLKYEGFKFDVRIKGPKHKNSKIIEVMVDANGYYLATTYKGPKSYLTLVVYELYTWKVIGTYKFKSRAELYNSYFSEDGIYFYLNTDIYKNKYTSINLKSGELKIMDCQETPKGCQFIEPKSYETLAYTGGENYLIFMDEDRKNDLKVYRNKDMIITNNYIEETPVVKEPVVEKEVTKEEPVKEVIKPLKDIEQSLTQSEIEAIKEGIVVEKGNLKFLIQNDSNNKFVNKREGDIRYVVLSLVDLSKLSFGNKVVNNNITIFLKN